MKSKEEDGRYPYTHCVDYIRTLAGYNSEGTKLSRSDASAIKSKIAEIIGMSERELSCKIADYYLDHQEEITQKGSDAFLRAIKVSL